jgi:threonylcarbamoyladenosine tRNA methylthiotransferase CDKAL1
MPLINRYIKPQKFYLETFGCTANVGDEMKMRAILRNDGHELVEESEADVVIVNTCTVTKRTELNVIKRLRELKGESKEVVVAGCMAAAQPGLVKSILGEDVTLITPRDICDSYSAEQGLDFDGVVGIIPIAVGCVGKCSYCIVKRAKGDLRSYKPEKIREAVKSAVERGAKEIRITAQDCSAYGWEKLGTLKFPELLEMATSVEGDFRIRVGMMNPFTVIHILDELLEAFDSEKIFKFFHVPVQSGSDKVLREMRRDYKAADFVEIVKSIRKRFEYSTLCTDFIIGFPTEREEDFFSSLNLLDEVKPEKVNITRFSPRPGTEASNLKDLLEREKKRRSRIFSSLYRTIVLEKNKELEGNELPVLITEKGKKGGVIGRDPAYRMIVLKTLTGFWGSTGRSPVYNDLPLGATYTVRIEEAKSTYLMGEVIA